MKVRNVSGQDRFIAANGLEVKAGETATVDKKLGKALCQQPDNWQPADGKTNDQEGDD